ncbi:M20/M25/M40 family metallo-hydrolase [Microbacterium sp.]|uniref:M20/M25/M40 family metallo-hydrolase n=1 Tax=Microbacterium sp. TaxID=51671 RepID=UPI003C1E7341
MFEGRRLRIGIGATIAAGAMIAVGVTAPAQAGNGTNTQALRVAVSATGVIDHLEAFQTIADANDDNRAAGTSGHVASAEYVESQLLAAGYEPWRQEFSYDKTIVDTAVLAQTAPGQATYEYNVDYAEMAYASEGDVIASVTPVDVNLGGDRASTSGCDDADFAGFPAGDIALIQRGDCTFREKAENAHQFGAVGVIIFNQGNASTTEDREALLFGTLNPPIFPLPVVGTTFALGEALATTAGLTMRLAFEAHVETVNTFNVLADTSGRTDRTVVVGGHLDSVLEGPGINDNGSGTATILETALQMAELGIDPVNRVRFAFWSGEEDGLIGSDFYVAQLTKREVKDHAVNLNFDMVGSPNSVRFVYDGDGDAFGTKGPTGSNVVEEVFLTYFASQGLATEPTAFDGRSDYFGFIENGIPAGGLFTGAEDIKSADEAATYGGTAGEAYDPCYHAACDDITNIDPVVLEQMADAIAHATLTFAMTSSAVPGTAKGKGGGADALQFKGNRALK